MEDRSEWATAEDERAALIAEIEAIDLEYWHKVKPYFERRDALLKRIEAAQQDGTLPLGYHWQAEDGTVFKMVIPAGRFVAFARVGWDRTRRGYLGEVKGALSKKAAEALGYILGKNWNVPK